MAHNASHLSTLISSSPSDDSARSVNGSPMGQHRARFLELPSVTSIHATIAVWQHVHSDREGSAASSHRRGDGGEVRSVAGNGRCRPSGSRERVGYARACRTVGPLHDENQGSERCASKEARPLVARRSRRTARDVFSNFPSTPYIHHGTVSGMYNAICDVFTDARPFPISEKSRFRSVYRALGAFGQQEFGTSSPYASDRFRQLVVAPRAPLSRASHTRSTPTARARAAGCRGSVRMVQHVTSIAPDSVRPRARKAEEPARRGRR
jgi:hypothetical protein